MRCKHCLGDITMMVQRGTGFCSPLCHRRWLEKTQVPEQEWPTLPGKPEHERTEPDG